MTLGVAVIGAGMAGRAHAAAYRVAPTLYASTLPDLRYVAIGDANAEFGALAARRFGYEKSVTSWQDVASDPDVDVVSVVVANHLHREMVEGLLDAGKHVLCEKPLSDTLENARAMAASARSARTVARIGFTYLRAPGMAALRQLVSDGVLGRVLHVDARYWCDYACDPRGPISWRFKGAPGTGALADIGSHATYLAEFLAGDVSEVSGGRFATVIGERPVPLSTTIGHGLVEVSDETEAVENDDYAAFSAQFGSGAVGVIQASRVSAGHPNGLVIELFTDRGAARWDQERPAEFELVLNDDPTAQRGFRRVNLGPEHPYLEGGLPMDAPGVGFGHNDGFAYQARAFLEEVAGLDEATSLPRCASFDEGVHNMEILAAVAESASDGGRRVAVPVERVHELAGAGAGS